MTQAERLGQALMQVDGIGDAATLAHLVPSPAFAEAVEALIAAWGASPEVEGRLLGAAIAGSAHAGEQTRRGEEVEVVISGPRSTTLHPRSTEQVMLGLIAEAQEELLLITFALEGYDDLRDAIRQAAERGVRVRVLAEDPNDAPGFYGDPHTALAGVPCERLRWPRERRPGRGAALHAKVVIVDRRAVFVTSANLTQRASADNFEVGLLLGSGDIGGRITSHIDELMATGVVSAAAPQPR